jgi:flagellar protein FlbD
MIPLHRLTHPDHPVYLNPDLIQTVEANPDTVVTLTNASKFVVGETPEAIMALIREWRAGILARALAAHEAAPPVGLAQVVHLAGRSDPPAQA